MTKIRYFHTGLLPIHFGFATCEQAFAREMKRLGIEKPPAFVTPGAAATTHTFDNAKTGGRTVIVCLCRCGKPKPEQLAGLIAHEAVHVWQRAKEHMGEERPGDEIEAYAVQWLTQCMLECLSWR